MKTIIKSCQFFFLCSTRENIFCQSLNHIRTRHTQTGHWVSRSVNIKLICHITTLGQSGHKSLTTDCDIYIVQVNSGVPESILSSYISRGESEKGLSASLLIIP